MPELSLPNAWSVSPESRNGSRQQPSSWGEEFSDPRVAEVVEQTLLRNPTIAVAAANAERALAFASSASADRGPDLQGQSISEGRQQRFIGFPLDIGQDVLSSRFVSHSIQLGWNWEIDIWGRLRAGARAGYAQAQAAQAELQSAALSLTGTALKAWFASIEATRLTQLADERLETWIESDEILNRRYRSGVASAVELEMAKGSLALAKAQLEERQTAARNVQRTLQELIGDYPDGSADLGATLPEPPEPIASGIPSDILKTRPDIRAAERQLAAANQSIWEARAALFPRLALTGSVGGVSADLNDLLDTDASVWSLAGAITAPFLNYGRLKSLVDAANAESQRRVSEYLANAYQALSEVESSLDLNNALIERESHMSDALKRSQTAMGHARRRYEAGLADRMSVLEAQRKWIADQEAKLRIDRLLLDNRVNLRLALGGYRLDESTAKPMDGRQENAPHPSPKSAP